MEKKKISAETIFEGIKIYLSIYISSMILKSVLIHLLGENEGKKEIFF